MTLTDRPPPCLEFSIMDFFFEPFPYDILKNLKFVITFKTKNSCLALIPLRVVVV